MRPVEITREGIPAKEDPQVETGMKVWDNLTSDEQREVFRSLYRHVVAHARTQNIDHLVRYADSVDEMVRMESTTDLRRKIRDSRHNQPVAADPADVTELIRRLEG